MTVVTQFPTFGMNDNLREKKKDALHSRSLVELSMAFVFLCACILLVVFSICAVFWFVLIDHARDSNSNRPFLFGVWLLWGISSFLLGRSMVRRIRQTPDLNLSDDGLFYFQVGAMLFVLVVWLLYGSVEGNKPEFVNLVRKVFEVLLLLSNVYCSGISFCLYR